MRIISRKRIREASAEHSEWAASLNAWYKITKSAEWDHFPDVRNSWRNSDKVGKVVVFDIANNRCRLIAGIAYEYKRVFIKAVVSHAEYDKTKWENYDPVRKK